MASMEVTPPVPPRKSSDRYSPHRSSLRKALADSFVGFDASAVSQNHIDCAKACIQSGEPPSTRYEIVDFVGNLERNKVKGNEDYLTMMTSAYDLLLKYAVNLLKKKRPQVWRSIKTNNTAFKARVACMEGAYDILNEIGYSQKLENSIQFPQGAASPDMARLCQIAPELLMAKLEVEDINRQQAATSASPPRARSSSGSSSQRIALQTSTGFVPAIDRRGFHDTLPEQYSAYQQPRSQAQYQLPSDHSQPVTLPPHPSTLQSSASRKPLAKEPYDTQPEVTQQNHDLQRTSYSTRLPNHSSFGVNTGYQQQQPPHSMYRQSQTEFIRPPLSGIQFDSYVKSSVSQEPHSKASSIAPPEQPQRQLHSSIDSQASSGGSTGGGSSSNSSSPLSSIGDQSSSHSSTTETEGSVMSSATETLARLRARRARIQAGLSRNTKSEDMSASKSLENAKKTVSQPIKPKDESTPPLPPKTYKEGEPSHEAKILKPPGKVRHPPFQNDPILEQPEPLDSVSSQSLEDYGYQEPQAAVLIPSRYCERCKNRIDPRDTTCSYCGPNGSSPALQSPVNHATIPEPKPPAVPPKIEPYANYEAKPHVSEPPPPTIPQKTPRFDRTPEVQPPPIIPQKTPRFERTPEVQAPPTIPLKSTGGVSYDQPPPVVPQKSPRLQKRLPAEYDEPILRASKQDAKAAEYKHQQTMIHAVKTDLEPPSFAPVPKESPVKAAAKIDSQNSPQPLKRRPTEVQYEPVPPTLPPKPPRECPPKSLAPGTHYHGKPLVPQEHYVNEPHPPDTQRAYPKPEDEVRSKPLPMPRAKDPQAYPRKPPHEPQVVAAMPRAKDPQAYPRKPPQEPPQVETPPKVPPRPNAAQKKEVPGPSNSSMDTLGGADASGEGSYIKTLKEKEKAWKECQLRQGVKAEDLEVLPERVEYDREQEEKRRRKEKEMAAEKRKKKQEAKQFAKINTHASPYEFDSAYEQKAQEIESAGARLLESVKECHQHGHSLDEIQIAFAYCSNRPPMSPLSFLQNEWVRMIHNVQLKVGLCRSHGEPEVGCPSIEEAKKFLVEANGDFFTALQANYDDRKKKISKLVEKFVQLRAVKPELGELTWEAATKVLSRNDMDVAAACHAVQCEWLYELHDYIFSEYKEVVQTEYENIKRLVKNEDLDLTFRHRMLMGECKLDSSERSKLALALLEKAEYDKDVPLNYCVEAAKDYNDLDKAVNFLIKECPLCFETTSVHEMVQMPGCTCTMCKGCFKGNFQVVMKEKPVKHFRCPTCEIPDIANLDEQSFYTTIFTGLIKEHLEKEHYDQCMKKLNEFQMIKDPGFRWCVSDKCKEGFIVDRANPHPDFGLEVACPSKSCHTKMCFNCKFKWDPWHQAQSCEAFAQWKKDNNPEAQEQGLAAHLAANGIECPHCHMRYDLARGGCMHFKCTQCPNEFCSGCGESFRNKMDCGRYESCAKLGFHAHHPRDCLFYLRDFSVKQLQDFLKDHNIAFDVETPPEQLEAARRAANEGPPAVAAAAVEKVEKKGGEAKEGGGDPAAAAAAPVAVAKLQDPLKCCVLLQKETQEGLKDEECGRIVNDGHAGLCEVHYKEYLVDKINKNKLDPVTIYETAQIQRMLERNELPVPEKEDDDTDDQYRQRLIEEVQQKLHLTFKSVQPKATPAPVAAAAAAAAVPQEMVVQDVEEEP